MAPEPPNPVSAGAAAGTRTASPRPGDQEMVRRLRSGDDRAFAEVVDAWSPVMLRVARSHVSTDASAEEVVQEAWMAVIRGLDQFEGRSALRTWVFRILTNLAKTRGVRESRTVPLSSLDSGEASGPSVDPERFRTADDPWPGGWTPVGGPSRWQPTPEDTSLTGELREQLSTSLTRLPGRQKAVVSLRDVHGLSAEEVCWALGISATNQRVLLHRARSRLRRDLEAYVATAEGQDRS